MGFAATCLIRFTDILSKADRRIRQVLIFSATYHMS